MITLNDIEKIKVHWSESNHINDELGCDDEGDIEKEVDVKTFDLMVLHASKEVCSGYDKTSLSIKLKSGDQWCFESKFYITQRTKSLLDLLKGE
tara:strand:- start:3709 stop:3990 length:282 start_codon:yes stop_codon:yes gene_type:complete